MNSQVVRIRQYVAADEAAVIALWREVLFNPAPHNDPATSLQMKLAVDRELLLVATVGDAVVGTVMGGYDGHRGWIYSVGVSPVHRRQGIGTALIRRMEEAIMQRGCMKLNLQVRATNAEVIAFYESLGFNVEDIISMGKRLYS